MVHARWPRVKPIRRLRVAVGHAIAMFMGMSLRSIGFMRNPPVAITVFGREVAAHPGDSLAAALNAADVRAFVASCHMGVCQQCLVRVNGRLVQACLTPVAAGMVVS